MEFQIFSQFSTMELPARFEMIFILSSREGLSGV
jgi:hypothetical protein